MSRWHAVTLGVVLVLGLSGCTAASDVDPDEVQNWLAQWDDAPAGEDSLAVLGGLAAREADTGGGEGVTATFESPVEVADLEFSCFGPDTMSVEVTITATDATQTVRTEDLSCADSPHTLDQTLPAVTMVTADGIDPDGVGGWGVVVRGEE